MLGKDNNILYAVVSNTDLTKEQIAILAGGR